MTTIKLKNGSGAPLAGDLVQGEPALDLTNKRLYTENSSGTVIEVGTNPGEDVTFADNRKAIFGAGSDFEIFHDGGSGYSQIKETGSAGLLIRSNDLRLQSSTGENGLKVTEDGAVTAYYDNAQKLATTSTGIDVTGTVVSDGLTLNGNATIQQDDALIFIKETDGTNIAAVGDLTGTGQGGAFYYDHGGTATIQLKSYEASIIQNGLGIGTTSASSRLTVKSPDNTLATNIAQFDSQNGGAGFKFGYQRIEQIGATVPITFETGGSESMRIDSSGNLLVGKTGNNTANEGFVAKAVGGANITSDGATTLELNRKASDGTIINFRKANTTVGSIGNLGGSAFYSGASTGVYFGTNDAVPTTGSGSLVDNSKSLGSSSYRWKDLYLSGTLNGISTTKTTSGNCWGILPEVASNGVMEIGRYIDFHSTNADTSDYGARLDFDGTNLISTAPIRASGGVRLGGQGAANTLDDYEEGTWTPTFEGSTTNPTVSYQNQTGTYTKVGNLVTLFCQLRTSAASGGSGSLMIAGIPFTVSGQSDECGGSVGLVINLTNSAGTDVVQADSSLNKLFLLKNTNNQGHTPTNLTNNTYLRCTIQYTTA